MKESEWRFMPEGHVWKIEANSIYEVYRYYSAFKEDEGKRASEVFFKMKPEEEWMLLRKFVDKYFAES